MTTILGCLQKPESPLALVGPSVLVLSHVSEKERSILQGTNGVEIVVSIAKRYPVFSLSLLLLLFCFLFLLFFVCLIF